MCAIGFCDFYISDNAKMKYPDFAERLQKLIEDKKRGITQTEAAKWHGSNTADQTTKHQALSIGLFFAKNNQNHLLTINQKRR